MAYITLSVKYYFRMIAGHHRAIKPRIIDCSLQSLGRAFRSSTNLNGTVVCIEAEDSFGGEYIAVKGSEGNFN